MGKKMVLKEIIEIMVDIIAQQEWLLDILKNPFMDSATKINDRCKKDILEFYSSNPGSGVDEQVTILQKKIDEGRKKLKPLFLKGGERYFERTIDGLYFGYHCEGGETFDLAGNIPLSVETLDNDRILFLANHYMDWYPFYLSMDKRERYRVLRCYFKMPEKTLTFNKYDEYHELFRYVTKTDRLVRTEKLNKYIEEGYHLFILGENDQKEITEAMLIYPKNYVTIIEEITLPK